MKSNVTGKNIIEPNIMHQMIQLITGLMTFHFAISKINFRIKRQFLPILSTKSNFKHSLDAEISLDEEKNNRFKEQKLERKIDREERETTKIS